MLETCAVTSWLVKTASQQCVTMGVNTGKYHVKQSVWKEGCIYICEDSL